MQRTLQAALMLGATVSAVSVGSCTLDPVHEGAVRSLGGEYPDFPNPDQYHRYGQPCVVCHSAQGPASTTFVLAGTVFLGPDKAIPVEGAYVRVLDSNKTQKCFTTNCNGNFFVRPEQFPALAFPILVTVQKEPVFKQMNGHIGREASCANCHKNPRFFDSPGQIRLYDKESEVPPQGPRACPPPGNAPPPPCPEDRP